MQLKGTNPDAQTEVLIEVAGGRLLTVAAKNPERVRILDWDAAEAAVILSPRRVHEVIDLLAPVAEQGGDVARRAQFAIDRLEHLLTTSANMTSSCSDQKSA